MSDDATAVEEDIAEENDERLNLTVKVESTGPCRKHVSVSVPEEDIVRLRDMSLDEFAGQAEVPGFRIGRVPRDLLQKRFKTELADQVKQKVLLQSLEQMSDENDIDPINQPDIDVDSLDIPDSGDFSYEFDVEVRPEFDVPDYSNFTLERPSGDISDEELVAYRDQMLESYATAEKVDRAAAADDSILCDLKFTQGEKVIRESADQAFRLRPTLRFQDAEIEGFDSLIAGASAGETKTTTVMITVASPVVEMRGEEVTVEFAIKEVRENKLPEMDKEFLETVNCETAEDFEKEIRSALERQVEFKQRQKTREQVLEKIVEASDWDLPESLVQQQTENALRREMLEMTQAGFTREQINARENEIRQNAIESTRQALKEHFVLDRIATQEEIECDPQDIDTELMMMSFQTGESLRRIRARMVKSGMIDNLEAQLRERKAVDFILDKASYKDVDREPMAENTVTSASFAICGNMVSSLIDDGAAAAEDEDE